MKTSYWLAATLGAALAFSTHAAAQDQTRAQDRTQTKEQAKDQARSQDRIQVKDQVRDQTRSRLRTRDGSCGQTPGTGQRRGASPGQRGGRGR